MERRIGLRIAYDGTQFAGFQRQPGKRTVEGEILSALKEIRAIEDVKLSKYRASSRTDRGVSAIRNVISVDTSFPPNKIQQALNARMENIWCTGTAVLPLDLDVRHEALSREYLYFMPASGLDVDRMRRGAVEFLGQHDFSKYARVDDRSPVRKIISFDISEKEYLLLLRVRGESFLWNQVRRIVWALEQVGKGLAEPEEISPEHYRLRKIGLAPPEKLILADVDIGIRFVSRGRCDRVAEDIINRIVEASARKELLKLTLGDLSNRQIGQIRGSR